VATARRQPVELLYTAEGARTGERWVIHPHQVIGWRDRTYVIAWCPQVDGWRTFRLDRVIDALPMDGAFAHRADFRRVIDPAELFRPGGDVDEVRVRFSRAMAGWARERYPDHEVEPDGSVIVTFRASSVEWLVRKVLEYGVDAEVVTPGEYREAVKRAVA
jgi:proteasome accessory factor C